MSGVRGDGSTGARPAGGMRVDGGTGARPVGGVPAGGGLAGGDTGVRPAGDVHAGSGLHARRAVTAPVPDPRLRWRRVGDALARLGLALTAICLGVVLVVVTCSTIWLMTDARLGNLTQSMSIFTMASADSGMVLAAGFAGGLAVLSLVWLAWRRGEVLDGPRATWALVGVTLAFQLVTIWALQTRVTHWGDSWMIDDFVDIAVARGVPAMFTGPYRTIYHDARLYFTCYPFQATFFWLMYGLRLLFGKGCFMALQVLSALANCLAVWALLDLGATLTPSVRVRRVLWVLVAACLPIYWLATFLYGNALGFGFASVFLALQARAMRAAWDGRTLGEWGGSRHALGRRNDARHSSDELGFGKRGADERGGARQDVAVLRAGGDALGEPSATGRALGEVGASGHALDERVLDIDRRSANAALPRALGRIPVSVVWVMASFVPLVVALCIKATFILFAIAVLLAWFVLAIRLRSGWALGACLCVVWLANSLSAVPFEVLRANSGGYEFGDALTTLNHLELGLRMGRGEFYVSVDGGEATFAPGGWSDHATAVWAASGENAEVQNATAARLLAADVVGFASHPSYAAWFFSVKLATEWADPTYQTLYYLSENGDVDGVRPNPADLSTPFGMASTVLTFLLDGYQTLVFGAAFGYVAWTFVRWRNSGKRRGGAAKFGAAMPGEFAAGMSAKAGVGRPAELGSDMPAVPNPSALSETDGSVRPGGGKAAVPLSASPAANPMTLLLSTSPAANPVTLLLAATFFTGFGCYLLWEAKAVYVLPFAIVVLPLSAAGLDGVFRWAAGLVRRLASRGGRA